MEKRSGKDTFDELNIKCASCRADRYLRCITCGSVDDGKSTLIGRLLYETRQIPDDQLANLENASTKYGARENEIDFALLTDGLSAERERE